MGEAKMGAWGVTSLQRVFKLGKPTAELSTVGGPVNLRVGNLLTESFDYVLHLVEYFVRSV